MANRWSVTMLCSMLTLSLACEKAAPEAAARETQAHSKHGDSNEHADGPSAPARVPPADAHKSASGLVTKVLEPGSGGQRPKTYDEVVVRYTAWNEKGKKFHDSKVLGRPDTLDVDGVIAGLSEGLQLMKVGERRRLWIPDELGYPGRPGFPRGHMVFDVELVEIREGKAPLPAPDDVPGPPADAEKTKSGLAYKVLEKGDSNQKPRAWDRVKIHYTGWTSDGTMFDSTHQGDAPARFDVGKVMSGWTEGLQLMARGDRARFWIPQALAYQGRPGRPEGMLVFDIELVSIERRPEPPRPPKNLAAAPARAKKTDSGLAYRVLERGKGQVRPGPTSRVELHYSGWTADGELFDSSVVRGHPATIRLDAVIPGWTEGLQRMVEGEKTLFWIPEQLAYGGQPGRPPGMLVYEVELLDIVE